MLNVYTGKINYDRFATNTIITFVVPDGKAQHHPCLVYWQWAINGANVKNDNITFTGQFRETATVDVAEIRAFDVDYYYFIWNLKLNKVQLMDKTGQKCGPPFLLKLVYPTAIPSPA